MKRLQYRVDNTRDIRAMGRYSRDGTIYIDRVAWDKLKVKERNAVIRHEKRELELRLSSPNMSYKDAHERALRDESGFTPELQGKLRGILSDFSKRPSYTRPPRNLMGGCLPSVEFSGSYRAGLSLVGTRGGSRPPGPGETTHVLLKAKDCVKCHLHYFPGDPVLKRSSGSLFCPECGGELK